MLLSVAMISIAFGLTKEYCNIYSARLRDQGSVCGGRRGWYYEIQSTVVLGYSQVPMLMFSHFLRFLQSLNKMRYRKIPFISHIGL